MCYFKKNVGIHMDKVIRARIKEWRTIKEQQPKNIKANSVRGLPEINVCT